MIIGAQWLGEGDNVRNMKNVIIKSERTNHKYLEFDLGNI